MTDARIVAEGLGFTEGPVWTTSGQLLVTSISHSAIYRLGTEAPQIHAKTGGGPNGMAEAADGTLYVAQNGGIYGVDERNPELAPPGIQTVAGSSVSYVAEGPDAPNDCCFGPDERLYFTDPRGPANVGNQLPGRVFALPPDGAPILLAEGPAFANGIAFGPDSSRLYVAETFRQRVLVYPLRDGALAEPEEFCKTDPGFPDGLCFDVAGQLYVATTLGQQIQVFDTAGNCIDRLPCGKGSMPTNCCFGGAQNKTLFVTDSRGQRVLAFDLEAEGLPLFPFR